MSKNVLWDATRKKKLKNIKVVRSIVQNLNGLKVEFFFNGRGPEGPGSIILKPSGGGTSCYKGPHEILEKHIDPKLR
jgi:hypothetical protein